MSILNEGNGSGLYGRRTKRRKEQEVNRADKPKSEEEIRLEIKRVITQVLNG